MVSSYAGLIATGMPPRHHPVQAGLLFRCLQFTPALQRLFHEPLLVYGAGEASTLRAENSPAALRKHKPPTTVTSVSAGAAQPIAHVRALNSRGFKVDGLNGDPPWRA